MKVLLTQNVQKVGVKGDVVEVNTGYASNFIIPRGLGRPASVKDAERSESQKEIRAQEKKEQTEKLTGELKKVNGNKITITANGDEKGHLYAGLNAGHIVPAINEQLGGSFLEEHLALNDPIKETGEHEVTLSVGGHKAKIIAEVVGE